MVPMSKRPGGELATRPLHFIFGGLFRFDEY